MDRKEKTLFAILGITASGIIVYEVIKERTKAVTTTMPTSQPTTTVTQPQQQTIPSTPPQQQQQQNVPSVVQQIYSGAGVQVPPEYVEKIAPGWSSCAGGYIRQYNWCHDSENINVTIRNPTNTPVVIQLWYCRNNFPDYEDPAGGGTTKPIVVPANSSIIHPALPYTMYTVALQYPGSTLGLCYSDCVVPGKEIVIDANKIQQCQKELASMGVS